MWFIYQSDDDESAGDDEDDDEDDNEQDTFVENQETNQNGNVNHHEIPLPLEQSLGQYFDVPLSTSTMLNAGP